MLGCEAAVWQRKLETIHCRVGGPGSAYLAQSRVVGPRIRPFVESRLGDARRQWQRCYVLALADAPQLEGSVVVTASISARGKLTVTHATGLPLLVACTSRALEGLAFGRQALSADSTRLTLQVTFQPNPWCPQ